MLAALLIGLSPLADGAAAPAASAAGGGNPLFNSMLVPLVLVFAVWWFLLINPRRKEQKKLEEWLKSLKKGDEVVTTGGLIGKVSGLTDQTVTLEVQEKVRLKVLRSSITGKAPSPTSAHPAPAAETQPAK